MTCSIRELARRVGITDTAINKMRANGRLPASLFGVKDSGRPYVINPDEAERVLRAALSPSGGAGRPRTEKITDSAAQAATVPESRPAPAPAPAESDRAPQPATAATAPQPEAPEPMQAGAYQKARTVRETFAAKLVQLEFQQKAGLLVSKDEIKSGIFTAGRKLRDHLMHIPNRLAPRLAGETDQHVITMLLTEEFNQALQELAHDFQRTAGDQ